MSRVSYAFYIFLLSLFSRNLEVISKSKYIVRAQSRCEGDVRSSLTLSL